MKKMSKLLSGAFALALAVCMSTTAFAAGPAASSVDVGESDGNGTADIDVQLAATLNEEEDVYKVNVAWTSMAFEYTHTASVWDADGHTRTPESGEWSNSGKATITVINHSNKGVTVDNSYEATTPNEYESGVKFNGVTVTLNDFANETLTAGVVDNPNGTAGQDMTTCELTVTGKPETNITEGVVGTITVTVAPQN